MFQVFLLLPLLCNFFFYTKTLLQQLAQGCLHWERKVWEAEQLIPSAEPHPANCLTDFKKKKNQEGKTANHNLGLSHKGKRSQKVLPFLKMQDFNHVLETVASFSKYA